MKLFSFKLSMFLSFLLCVNSQVIFGQHPGFNLIDRFFYPNSNTEVDAQIQSVLADTDRIFTAGSTLSLDANNFIISVPFLTSYDMDGKKIFQKYNVLPDPMLIYSIFGCSNIEKTENEHFVIGCNALNSKIRWDAGGIVFPYLTIFNKEGQTLNTISYQLDTLHSRTVFGLAINNSHEILGIGLQGSTTKVAHGCNLPYPYYDRYSDFWLFKADKDGNLLWHKNYPDLRAELTNAFPLKIVVDKDQEGYLIAGKLNSDSNPYLLKVDSSGNELWYKKLVLAERYEDHPACFSDIESIDIAPANDGGYYFITSSPYTATWQSTDTIIEFDDNRIYYGKLNENGDTVWTKQFSPSQFNYNNSGRQIRVAQNGDLIMTFNSDKYDTTQQPGLQTQYVACVLRTDSIGNLKWYKEPMSYTVSQNNQFTKHFLKGLNLVPGSDNILAGGMYGGLYDPVNNPLQELGKEYPWLILMDSSGRRCEADTISVGVPYPCISITSDLPLSSKDINSNENILLYPNPANDFVHINLGKALGNSAGVQNYVQLRIYDLMGREMQKTKLSESKNKIDISGLPKGIYIFQMWNKEVRTKTWKVVRL